MRPPRPQCGRGDKISSLEYHHSTGRTRCHKPREGPLKGKPGAEMNAQEAADILGVNRRRHDDLREMVRALTLFPWFNSAEDEKRREAARWALAHWAEYQAEC